MTYGTVGTDTIQSSTTGTPTQFNDGSGTQIGTLCRAWASNAGGVSGVQAAFNISSITYNSTGNYTIAFTNALSDTNYVVCCGGVYQSSNLTLRINSKSTTGFTAETLNYLSADNNPAWGFSVFR